MIHALLLSLLVGPVGWQEAAVRLEEVRITIELDRVPARVSAVYRIVGVVAPVRFRALRVPGQRIALIEEETTGLTALEKLPGLYRVTLSGSGPDEARLRLSYTVSGGEERIPLFVPEPPAAPGGAAIEIRVEGGDVGPAVRGGFPRFGRAREGGLLTRPENLPSFVWLPSPLGRSLARAADAAVLLLIAGGTLGWLALRARARRRDGAAAHEPVPRR